MAIVTTDDKYYKKMAETIRRVSGSPQKMTPSEMAYSGLYAAFSTAEANGYEFGRLEGETIGGQETYNTFWDNFQIDSGKEIKDGKNYYYAFAYYCWNDTNYNPKHPIIANGDNTALLSTFYNSSITDTKVNIYANKSIQAIFYQSKIKRVPLLSLLETTNISTAFYAATDLEDITIEGIIGKDMDMKSCGKLTKKSIKSVIDHLSPNTSGKTLTLSEKAVNKAFETSEGANDGTSSAEWEALGGTNRERQNWTIALS